LVLIENYYRFTQQVHQKTVTYFSNKPQEKVPTVNQFNLLGQVSAVRSVTIN